MSLYVTVPHLLDIAVMECVWLLLLMSPTLYSPSLVSLPQDGWQTLVSGLVAFLRLWHQHSKFHGLGTYLCMQCHICSHETNPNSECSLLPLTLLQSNKPTDPPSLHPSFLAYDALKCAPASTTCFSSFSSLHSLTHIISPSGLIPLLHLLLFLAKTPVCRLLCAYPPVESGPACFKGGEWSELLTRTSRLLARRRAPCMYRGGNK